MRRIHTLLLAGLSIAGITYLLNQSSLMRDRLAPFLFRLTLIIRDLLFSTSDIVYWALFCALLLFIGFATIFRLFTIWLNENDAPLNTDPSTPVGPVKRYADWIDNTVDGVFYRRQLARELAVFSFEIMQRPEQGLPEIDAAIAQDNAVFSPEVAAYMRQGTSRKEISTSDRMLSSSGMSSTDALDGLVATVEMLEQQLGIDPPQEDIS